MSHCFGNSPVYTLDEYFVVVRNSVFLERKVHRQAFSLTVMRYKVQGTWSEKV